MTKLSRRQFFRTSTALAAGSAMPVDKRYAGRQSATKPAIQRYKPLGKTGWRVGDISAGSGQTDPAIVNYLFEL